jgi:hypothetical protein
VAENTEALLDAENIKMKVLRDVTRMHEGFMIKKVCKYNMNPLKMWLSSDMWSDTNTSKLHSEEVKGVLYRVCAQCLAFSLILRKERTYIEHLKLIYDHRVT